MTTASPADGKTPKPRREQRPFWQETLLLLAIALGLAIVIKAFFVQAFYIPSQSMTPGLHVNDRILVQKVSYWDGEPQRGDVVVFKDPGGWLSPFEAEGPTNLVARAATKIGLYPAGGHLVKRVIGVPGDTIHCCDDQGRLEINGKAIDESGYVKQDKALPCAGYERHNCDWTAGPVPEGRLFLMGDNRANSADSAYHLCAPRAKGCDPDEAYVPARNVVGKAFVLMWPVDRFRLIGRPDRLADVPGPRD